MFQNLYKAKSIAKSTMTKRSVGDERETEKVVLKKQITASTFPEAMKFSMKLAQCLSFFPIDIEIKPGKDLNFKWLHWRIVYSFITFLFFVLELVLHVYNFVTSSNKPTGTIFTIIVVFYLGAIVQYILFFKFTVEYPIFVKEWKRVEDRMKNYEIFCNLRINLNCITASIMLFAAVEHTLVNVYKLLKCLRTNPTIHDAVKVYFIKSYGHIFTNVEYSLWKGVLAQFLNLQRTFNWNFADVFVMIISTAFKFRLKQMFKRVKTLSRVQVMDINLFGSVRKDYEKLVDLCNAINNRISWIVIVCFSLNLFFILFQLFNSLKEIDNTTEKVYFYISFGLILLRAICLCIFGGEIYEEWRNIATSLFSVRSSAYNVEVERFINHVITHRLVLTGKNLFSVTRNLILKIAGATVTYELVLIQFNSEALQQVNY